MFGRAIKRETEQQLEVGKISNSILKLVKMGEKMFKEKMHERLNSAKYTREEYGRITWRRSSMKKMILRSFDGRRNEVEGPIEKITWGEMKAAR